MTTIIDYDAIAAERTPIILEMVAVPKRRCYFKAEESFGHVFESAQLVRGTFRHQGVGSCFSVHYGDEHHWTRREHGGPVEQVEYAYLAAQPTVIQAHHYGNLGRKPAIDVSNGDVLKIQGRLFQIRDDRWGRNPSLVRIDN